MKNIVIILICVGMLNGCTLFSNIYKQLDKNEANISGAGAIFYEPIGLKGFKADGFGTLHYCKLLQHYGFVKKVDKDGGCYINTKEENNVLTSTNFPLLRDEVQDRVLASSNQKCGHFMKTLYSLKGDTEVFWGSLSTLLSGAGAVLSHVPTAKAFAAGGAATSGIRSELEQAYFANKAIEVITAGIQARRNEILANIKQKRLMDQQYLESKTVFPSNKEIPKVISVDTGTGAEQNKSNRAKGNPLRYSLNGAISDALAYHAACSTITGLEVAAKSISRVENPGTEEFKKFLKGLEKSGIKGNVTVDLNKE